MTKHTPGPWHIKDGKVFAAAICRVDGTPDGSAEANAQLIAAAPELLEACKIAMKIVQYPNMTKQYSKASYEYSEKARELISIAIAKVEGTE